MKITYVLNSGNPGGMEQHVLDLVKVMNDQLNRVYVWCREGEISQWYEEAGAEVHITEIGFDIDPIFIYRFAAFLKRENIDIVHAHELKSVVNALIAGKLAGVPVLVTHTHTPISTWQISPIKKKLNTIFYSLFINLFSGMEIALTESRKRIKKNEGINEDKIKVIHNALDLEKFKVPLDHHERFRKTMHQRYGIPENALVFGNVSRLTEEKGHMTLIEGFDKFLNYALPDKNNIYLLIAGGGKLEEQVTKLISEKGLERKIKVSGKFPADDLVKFYSSFDAFVFPSLAEGFGIVLIEAMYSGLPIVCSDLEVLQEVGGSTVFYFEAGNAEDLAGKMLSLYQKKEHVGKLTNNAVQRVEKLFTLEKFGDAYNALYHGLLEEHK